jgi:hydrogenase nickel insertion protein HypA/hydrogenase assembly chaperone HypC/HupF
MRCLAGPGAAGVERFMCLAVPSKVISLGNEVALIDFYGARKEVSLKLLPETPKIGDYLLVHAGFAIQKISSETVHPGEFMHESSLAINILEIAGEQCRARGLTVVDTVTVRLGKASGVSSESLEFAFNALKADTVAGKAKLIFDIVPLGGTCGSCKKAFEAPDAAYVLSCPHCGSDAFKVSKGSEMEIVSMEIH